MGSSTFEEETLVLCLRRVHYAGTKTTIRQAEDGWHIHIDLRQTDQNPVTIVGYLLPTMETAKHRADHEIMKLDHVCNGDCEEWEEFVQLSIS